MGGTFFLTTKAQRRKGFGFRAEQERRGMGHVLALGNRRREWNARARCLELRLLAPLAVPRLLGGFPAELPNGGSERFRRHQDRRMIQAVERPVLHSGQSADKRSGT